jgi:hypothetical protein
MEEAIFRSFFDVNAIALPIPPPDDPVISAVFPERSNEEQAAWCCIERGTIRYIPQGGTPPRMSEVIEVVCLSSLGKA